MVRDSSVIGPAQGDCTAGLKFDKIGFDQNRKDVVNLYVLKQLNPNFKNWKPAVQ